MIDHPFQTNGPTQGEERVAESEDTHRVLQALTDGGLLVPGDTVDQDETIGRVQPGNNALLSKEGLEKPVVPLGHWVAFFHASLTASWKLRFYSMYRTVRSVDKRKRQRIKAESKSHDDLCELVAIFHHLRPFYWRKYRCLYDSLALVEFLAHFNIFPHWVFGVNSAPFSAHCWVQIDDEVLNDSVERVCSYTPIMSI